jgi:NADH-quinone oxidoreductase subunit M
MILVAFLATLGLPGFSGFIGEVLVIFGSFGSSTIPLWIVVLSLGGLILGAGYCLWLIQRMFFGPYIQKVPGDLPDLTIREKLMLLPLAGIIFLLGIFPQNALKFMNTFSQLLSEQLSPFVTP